MRAEMQSTSTSSSPTVEATAARRAGDGPDLISIAIKSGQSAPHAVERIELMALPDRTTRLKTTQSSTHNWGIAIGLVFSDPNSGSDSAPSLSVASDPASLLPTAQTINRKRRRPRIGHAHEWELYVIFEAFWTQMLEQYKGLQGSSARDRIADIGAQYIPRPEHRDYGVHPTTIDNIVKAKNSVHSGRDRRSAQKISDGLPDHTRSLIQLNWALAVACCGYNESGNGESVAQEIAAAAEQIGLSILPEIVLKLLEEAPDHFRNAN